MSEQQPMTLREFFDEAARLKLRAPMSHADMCAAFDAKDRNTQ